MGFWAKSLRIFNLLCDNGKQSVRDIARKTGFSKSSVHRLEQAMERRNCYPESWFWETEEGRSWIIRLVVATFYTFGLKRGAGAESIREFFSRLRLGTHVGCSPSALRGVMQRLEEVIVEIGRSWQEEGIRGGEVRPVIGAVDETFFERISKRMGCQSKRRPWTRFASSSLAWLLWWTFGGRGCGTIYSKSP